MLKSYVPIIFVSKWLGYNLLHFVTKALVFLVLCLSRLMLLYTFMKVTLAFEINENFVLTFEDYYNGTSDNKRPISVNLLQ